MFSLAWRTGREAGWLWPAAFGVVFLTTIATMWSGSLAVRRFVDLWSDTEASGGRFIAGLGLFFAANAVAAASRLWFFRLVADAVGRTAGHTELALLGPMRRWWAVGISGFAFEVLTWVSWVLTVVLLSRGLDEAFWIGPAFGGGLHLLFVGAAIVLAGGLRAFLRPVGMWAALVAAIVVVLVAGNAATAVMYEAVGVRAVVRGEELGVAASVFSAVEVPFLMAEALLIGAFVWRRPLGAGAPAEAAWAEAA
jgi:hypothetical protein